MPPTDETTIPDTRTPAPNVNVNVGNGRAPVLPALGLDGTWRTVANFSAVVVIVGLFVSVTVWNRVDWQADRSADRAERISERELFSRSIDKMNEEQNRRTGEVKGSSDKLIEEVRRNSEVVRQWIEESRASRNARGLPARPPESSPKPPTP